MKKNIWLALALVMIVSLIMAGCAPAPTPAAEETAAEETAAEEEAPIRVLHVGNGVLGDKSFFDSAQRGIEMAETELGWETETIELGTDPANWESGLQDAMSETDSYDILVVGTWQMIEFLQQFAPDYPDKYFIIYDVSAAYDDPEVCPDGCSNIYSILYKQNEGSYLAGVYAAAMTQQTAIEGINEDLIIGAVGGQDIPVINDFIVGYEQGARSVAPDIEVIIQYAGGWNDPAKGKELALAMHNQCADFVFQIAGGTGVGVFEAATEQGVYAIGVDSDQATIIADTDPDQAEHIPTSMMKNVDNSLIRAFRMFEEGTLPFGEAEALGVAEGGVGLAYNDWYYNLTPQTVQDMVSEAQEALLNGDIVVDTVF